MSRKNIALEFAIFYTKDKEKRIPNQILNESLEKRKWFFFGFYAADVHKKSKYKKICISQKHKITISIINFLSQSLGLKICNSMRGDKFNIFKMIAFRKQIDEKVHKIKNLGKINDYVLDIETETHDFICGFPLMVRHTDFFIDKNFYFKEILSNE